MHRVRMETMKKALSFSYAVRRSTEKILETYGGCGSGGAQVKFLSIEAIKVVHQ